MHTVRMLVLWGAIALATAWPSPASAHESREVAGYEFVVGWYDEPAFANQKNGPEVTITNAQGDPVVEGVELSVDVGFEAETRTFQLEPAFVVGVFGEPGNYNADLYPTRSGTYTYRIYGTVEGKDIDEEFTSGPETFGDIEDPGEVAFPVEDPQIAELADQVGQVAEDADAAASARTLGYVATGLGVLALLVAVVALVRKRPA